MKLQIRSVPVSNLLVITDTLGLETRYDYDANNCLIKVTDALSSAGEATSSYAFADEWSDLTGLIYLRAGNYSPCIPQAFNFPVHFCTG